ASAGAGKYLHVLTGKCFRKVTSGDAWLGGQLSKSVNYGRVPGSRNLGEKSSAAAPRVSPADGLAAFRAFLKTEFSEENLEFWLACEDFKKTRSAAKLASKAQRIFEEFIDVQAPREVNIDFQTRELTRRNVQEPSLSCFDQAQGKVHSLMEKDSYPRFLRSKIYTDLLSQTQRRLS
uniref:Regulator of G-protein signaling 8 n=1 Tax=Cyanistes caeruleus TaxID=156563 RepID=A0A8C0VPJ9_CYACU